MSFGFVKNSDIQDAEKYTYCDDFDMLISPKNGRLVPVAMKHGVHVCWQCGDQFEAYGAREMVEKTTPGATVAVGVHRKCVGGKNPTSFFTLAKATQTRRAIADIARKTAGLITGE